MLRSMFQDKNFIKTFIALAIPIAMQNLVGTALNMTDTVMVGQLGETAISAVGQANQIFFLMSLFLFGVTSGAAIFTAQYWGKGDIYSIRKIQWLCLLFGTLVAAVFSLVSIAVPGWVMRLFTNDAEVIRLGAGYLRVVAFSYIITAVTFTYSSVLRSTGNVKLPMMVNIMALCINTLLNYLLIFGLAGFPRMGVTGSATATLIARVIEMCVMLWIVYKREYPAAIRFKEVLDITRSFVRKFFCTVTPVILNEGMWAAGVSIYTVVYGRMGTDIYAAVNIASIVERLAMVVFFGMAHACAVMVGNRIGAGDEETAQIYAKRFIILGPAAGVLMGIVLVLVSRWVVLPFRVAEDVRMAAVHLLWIMGSLMALRIFNTIMIVGVLRSGGDTIFTLIMDMGGTWCIAVPLALLSGLVWKFPLHWVYILIAGEEVYKFLLGLYRFASRKWIRNLVQHG